MPQPDYEGILAGLRGWDGHDISGEMRDASGQFYCAVGWLLRTPSNAVRLGLRADNGIDNGIGNFTTLTYDISNVNDAAEPSERCRRVRWFIQMLRDGVESLTATNAALFSPLPVASPAATVEKSSDAVLV